MTPLLPGLIDQTPGSVPCGIQEKVTRSSIRRKNGRSGTFLAALVGRSAALARPVEASAATENATAAMMSFRNDMSKHPQVNERMIWAHAPFRQPLMCDSCAVRCDGEASSFFRGCRRFH